MKKLISILILTALLTTLLFADTIYLKSGKIIKGKIVEADRKSLTIKTETEWFRIDRQDIEKIDVKDEKVIEKTTPKEKPEEKGEENKWTYYQGKKDGEIAGGAESAMACGFISGGCLGPFGGCLFPMVRTEPYDNMMKDIEHKSEVYKSGFRDGFKEKRKSQFKKGVGIGTIIPVVVTTFYLIVIIPQLKNFPYR